MISEDHVTEDWSNDAENTALITRINYILQYIHIENIGIMFLQYFWSDKCSLGEQKRCLLKTKKFCWSQTVWAFSLHYISAVSAVFIALTCLVFEKHCQIDISKSFWLGFVQKL